MLTISEEEINTNNSKINYVKLGKINSYLYLYYYSVNVVKFTRSTYCRELP